MSNPAPTAITIRTGFAPGDLGMITHLHGVVYAREYGLDTTFEPYVAPPLADLVLGGPDCGQIWIAEQGARTVGSVAIVRSENVGEAQLRWFLITPESRGTGLGRRLMDAAMAYSQEQKFQRIFLWSFDELHAALHLYRAYGFIETERTPQMLWGRMRTEVRMNLKLS
jgi:GNAT superfamily N-acetyltransferase